MNVLDSFILKPPANQNILDLFDGEWSSRLPDKFGLITRPGTARLFEDPRIEWVEEILGSFINLNILELGPLEGGHSYMFQNKGASKIVAVEANSRAFFKCLCIKEIFNLNKVEFKLGDFVSFLKSETDTKYDVVVASGVLYHLENAVELIKLISLVTNKLMIWTHYFDDKIINSRKEVSSKFSKLKTLEFEGETYEYSTKSYDEALNWSGFCGGSKSVCKWLTKSSIIKAIEVYGFNEIVVGFEQKDHQNGPSFAICASKNLIDFQPTTIIKT
jgi:hypothetical protein